MHVRRMDVERMQKQEEPSVAMKIDPFAGFIDNTFQISDRPAGLFLHVLVKSVIQPPVCRSLSA